MENSFFSAPVASGVKLSLKRKNKAKEKHTHSHIKLHTQMPTKTCKWSLVCTYISVPSATMIPHHYDAACHHFPFKQILLIYFFLFFFAKINNKFPQKASINYMNNSLYNLNTTSFPINTALHHCMLSCLYYTDCRLQWVVPIFSNTMSSISFKN